MNSKKIITVICTAVFSISSLLLFTSCGEEPNEECVTHIDENNDGVCDTCAAKLETNCTQHTDTDKNGKCDKCDEKVESAPDNEITEINVEISVKDQDGNLIDGIEVVFYQDEEEITRVTANNGVATVAISPGEYMIGYDSVIEGYLAIPETVEILPHSATLDLIIENNIPNGTVERPFVIVEDNHEVTVNAGQTLNFRIPFASGRTMTIIGESLQVTYNGEEYISEDGNIEIQLVETDSRAPALFSITNKSNSDESAEISLISKAGGSDNPISIDTLDDEVDAELASDETVYYIWTAENDGVFFTIDVGEGNGYFRLTNLDSLGTQQTATVENAKYTYISVNSGERILISVSVKESATNMSVSFKCDFCLADETDPILLIDHPMYITVNSGESYVFSINSWSFPSIFPDAEITVIHNGNIVEPQNTPYYLCYVLNGLDGADLFEIRNDTESNIAIEFMVAPG